MTRHLPVRRLLAVLVGLAVTISVVPAARAGDGPALHRQHAAEGAYRSSGFVVWTHRAAPGSEHLMVAHADGSHARVLTPPQPDTTDIDAQVSPDGRWVAYEEGSADSASIHLVHPDGRGDHVVDVGCVDECVAAANPTWLSKRRLAFALVKGPFDDQTGAAASAVLWTAHVDGTGVRRLSEPGIDGAFEDGSARLSRDHSYLTFKRLDNATGESALFRRDRRSGRLTQLTPWGLRADVNDLSTARRGRTRDLLVFESYGRGDPDRTFVDLATVPATCRSLAACTKQIRWLTDNEATGRRNANPQWSPEGRSLVFTDRPGIDVENADIFTMRFGSHSRHQVSTSTDFDYRPTWGARAAAK